MVYCTIFSEGEYMKRCGKSILRGVLAGSLQWGIWCLSIRGIGGNKIYWISGICLVLCCVCFDTVQALLNCLFSGIQLMLLGIFTGKAALTQFAIELYGYDSEVPARLSAGGGFAIMMVTAMQAGVLVLAALVTVGISGGADLFRENWMDKMEGEMTNE